MPVFILVEMRAAIVSLFALSCTVPRSKRQYFQVHCPCVRNTSLFFTVVERGYSMFSSPDPRVTSPLTGSNETPLITIKLPGTTQTSPLSIPTTRAVYRSVEPWYTTRMKAYSQDLRQR